MNPVVMIVYNTTDSQLALTKSAVESVAAQDVGDMELWIINNGSTEPTRKWLDFLKRQRLQNVATSSVFQTTCFYRAISTANFYGGRWGL